MLSLRRPVQAARLLLARVARVAADLSGRQTGAKLAAFSAQVPLLSHPLSRMRLRPASLGKAQTRFAVHLSGSSHPRSLNFSAYSFYLLLICDVTSTHTRALFSAHCAILGLLARVLYYGSQRLLSFPHSYLHSHGPHVSPVAALRTARSARAHASGRHTRTNSAHSAHAPWSSSSASAASRAPSPASSPSTSRDPPPVNVTARVRPLPRRLKRQRALLDVEAMHDKHQLPRPTCSRRVAAGKLAIVLPNAPRRLGREPDVRLPPASAQQVDGSRRFGM